MSLNKFMHPRNIYKTAPDFKELAIQFPDFRKHVRQELSGKVSIDFKDVEALKALTRSLLKKDFDLSVDIPPNRLIPTVPLRLNYILWLEDLLQVSDIKENIQGIDIGTGACCIYALLGAKLKNWRMTATDIDPENYRFALKNVQDNNLQDMITVKMVDKENILSHISDESENFDFCMCNPPFFSSIEETNPFLKARKETRPPPRNGYSAGTDEVVVPGGEIDFVSRLVKESLHLKSKIKIFTTMLGQKSSLSPLKQLLRSVEVACFKQTEFCQGRTTRWGLAWTFLPLDLRKVPDLSQSVPKKVQKPMKFVLPESEDEHAFQASLGKIKTILIQLSMEYEIVRVANNYTVLSAVAKSDTWSNQRRKRREKMRREKEISTNSKMDTSGSSADVEMEVGAGPCAEDTQNRPKRQLSDDEEPVKKIRPKEGEETSPASCEQMPYLICTIFLKRISSELHLEMSWEGGRSGKDTIQQVMQYFKNNWKNLKA